MSPDSSPDDLVASEGFDEGSRRPEPPAGPTGSGVTGSTEPADDGAEPALAQVAPPVPPAAGRTSGPGQELAAGEG